ncbi:TlpA disulfide reductase family protein [Desulfogranum marinum]|uniref:TlpA disulfide reductase family protein n=1 Tax=Desulfogranum marinum TaxID=453220 RepID=UPI001963EF9E|nr:TlpA disulfide reductase family protein [Desulfogranum marinum]MBM9511389.1 TlpA family protein disulfide reductase [Desulfogranum marinum]
MLSVGLRMRVLSLVCSIALFGLPMTTLGAVDMPRFSLPSVTDGKVVESSSFAGKALLVTFFATWCAPCRQEVPVLKELHQKFEGQGFSVIGLSVDEKGPGVVAELVEQAKINYPVLMADRLTPRKFGGIIGIPTSFLINKAGHVVKKYPGYIPRGLLEKDIKSIL